MTKVHLALQKAVAWHEGQDRDGQSPLPYACHPIEVAGILRNLAQVEEEADLCAAFLHDVLEETPATLEEIEAGFGPEVASLVKALTRQEPTPEEVAGLSREEVYEKRSGMLLAEIAAMSPRVQRIKLCDRLSNLREAKLTRSPEKLLRYARQTKKILEIIPRSASPAVWDKVDSLVKGIL